MPAPYFAWYDMLAWHYSDRKYIIPCIARIAYIKIDGGESGNHTSNGIVTIYVEAHIKCIIK